MVNLDREGRVVGVSLKSGRIDAGATRDFGPRVRVLRMVEGKKPDLNRPVVLSPEGKLAEPVAEKTLLQKYWWGEFVPCFVVVGKCADEKDSGVRSADVGYDSWRGCGVDGELFSRRSMKIIAALGSQAGVWNQIPLPEIFGLPSSVILDG